MMAGDPFEKEVELPLRSGKFISDRACFSLASGSEEAAARSKVSPETDPS
jgi:hypothetical protein